MSNFGAKVVNNTNYHLLVYQNGLKPSIDLLPGQQVAILVDFVKINVLVPGLVHEPDYIEIVLGNYQMNRDVILFNNDEIKRRIYFARRPQFDVPMNQRLPPVIDRYSQMDQETKKEYCHLHHYAWDETLPNGHPNQCYERNNFQL